MNPTWLLLLAAIGLAGAVGLELRPEPKDDSAMPARPSPLPVPPSDAAPPAGTDRAAIAALLARPLFAPDRRPAPAAAEPAAVRAPLPRVAGILIDGGRRSVIFAAATEGARPLVVGEGAEVNGFRVQSIEAGQVTLAGPDGPRTVRPSFDPRPPPAAAQPGQPNLQGLLGIPGLPMGGPGGLPPLPGLPGPPVAR